jgi:hypothetical protein
MKRFLISIPLLPAPLAVLASTSVGVSIGVGQPGYYGKIELGALPPPPVIYSTPMVIQPAPVGVILPPMYLRVPPAHYNNWRHYCGYYHACARPVYFVNDGWYRNTYVPYYRHPPPRAIYRGYDPHRNPHYDGRHDYR